MRLVVALMGLVWAGTGFAAKEGGELGNAFVPFDSKAIGISLEYAKSWRYNDLSQIVSFAAANSTRSFFSVLKESAGPATPAELLEHLLAVNPGVAFSAVSLAGLSGFEGIMSGTRQIYLLRAPREMFVLRMRSSDGNSSDQVLSHMLESFRVE